MKFINIPENKDNNNSIMNNQKESIEINKNNNETEKEDTKKIENKDIAEINNILLKIEPNVENNEINDKDNYINKNNELNINSEMEKKYISFNQDNFADPIIEENENKINDLNNDEYKDFSLIPNKELFKICGTNSDINDINERVYDKKFLKKYTTYPFDELNIFMILKQPKEKVKDNIMKDIQQRLKNKKLEKTNNKTNNKNFFEYKYNKKIEPKELTNNNFNNHYYHIINNSKEKQKINNNNIPISQKGIKDGELIKNNRKFKIEKINSSNNSSQKNLNENTNKNDNNTYINIIHKNKNNNRDIASQNDGFQKNNNYENNSDINKENIKKDNYNYIYSLDKRIDQIRETLNSINVIDTFSEQAGLQCYKDKNIIDDDLYFEKAKNLNKEFYDNLNIRFNQIEDFLNQL